VPRPAPPTEQLLLARAARKKLAAQKHEAIAAQLRAEASRLEDQWDEYWATHERMSA
jgi:hypothetical protein